MELTQDTNFLSVSELGGDDVTREQVQRICDRYYWAENYATGKDVVEVACGTGQGLGLLLRRAKSLVAGDISPAMVDRARAHYGKRVPISILNAMDLPFDNASKDLILLFEAIYYLPNAAKFIEECRRVLRPGGKVLVATSNKDLFDFNPSPFSVKYFGVVELKRLFEDHGFAIKAWGNTPVGSVSVRQKILRPIKKAVVGLGLMPKTMNGKKLLKRLVFGGLVPMPVEIDDSTAPRKEIYPISVDTPDTMHKVLLVEAML